MIFCVFFCNGYALKTTATIEGRIADACHAVSYCYARKPSATIECFIVYAYHAVRDSYARKPSVAKKGIIPDTRHTSIGWNDTVFTT